MFYLTCALNCNVTVKWQWYYPCHHHTHQTHQQTNSNRKSVSAFTGNGQNFTIASVHTLNFHFRHHGDDAFLPWKKTENINPTVQSGSSQRWWRRYEHDVLYVVFTPVQPFWKPQDTVQVQKHNCRFWESEGKIGKELWLLKSSWAGHVSVEQKCFTPEVFNSLTIKKLPLWAKQLEGQS